jgi:hypothetical protein
VLVQNGPVCHLIFYANQNKFRYARTVRAPGPETAERDVPERNPMRQTFPGCCARDASGDAAAAPPSVAKNFRRPMSLAI